MDPAIAAAICTGILGLTGVLIAVILKRGESHDNQWRRESDMNCAQHSGVTTNLEQIKKDIDEIKQDLKRIDKNLTKIISFDQDGEED